MASWNLATQEIALLQCQSHLTTARKKKPLNNNSNFTAWTVRMFQIFATPSSAHFFFTQRSQAINFIDLKYLDILLTALSRFKTVALVPFMGRSLALQAFFNSASFMSFNNFPSIMISSSELILVLNWQLSKCQIGAILSFDGISKITKIE